MRLLVRCLQCFLLQTYTPRELVLLFDVNNVNADALRALVGEILGDSARHDGAIYSVQCVAVDEAGRTLGELRNEIVQHARGQYIIQWDDDDWHSPHRMKVQLQSILAQRETTEDLRPTSTGSSVVSPDGRVVASMMTRWIHKLDHRYVLCQSNRWPGSLMCEKTAMPLYTARAKSEDSVLGEELLELGHGVALVCDAGLYVYEYHGANTWSRRHVEELIDTYGVAEYSEEHLCRSLGYQALEMRP